MTGPQNNGTLQFGLAIAIVIALLILLLFGHPNDPATAQVITTFIALLGPIAGFLLRDGISARNSKNNEGSA